MKLVVTTKDHGAFFSKAFEQDELENVKQLVGQASGGELTFLMLDCHDNTFVSLPKEVLTSSVFIIEK